MQSSFVATQQAARPPTNSSSTLHLLDSSMTRIPARAAAWPAAAEPTVAAATEPAVLARQHDYLYYDTDTLSVYMVSPPLGLIEETDEVVPGLLVDYTVDKRIVSVDVRGASKRVPVHFWDTAAEVEGVTPLCLQEVYLASDCLQVTFVANPSYAQLLRTYDDRITVLVDQHGMWESLIIAQASQSICQGTVTEC